MERARWVQAPTGIKSPSVKWRQLDNWHEPARTGQTQASTRRRASQAVVRQPLQGLEGHGGRLHEEARFHMHAKGNQPVRARHSAI